MTSRVVFLGPLFLEQSLSTPITPLLLQVRSNRNATMVPYNSRWAESQLQVPFLETPADVHVVSRDPKPFIEATNFKQRGLPIGHVAAWNVLSLAIGQHHVDGTAR
jgi:hypothetical protein